MAHKGLCLTTFKCLKCKKPINENLRAFRCLDPVTKNNLKHYYHKECNMEDHCIECGELDKMFISKLFTELGYAHPYTSPPG